MSDTQREKKQIYFNNPINHRANIPNELQKGEGKSLEITNDTDLTCSPDRPTALKQGYTVTHRQGLNKHFVPLCME